MKNRMVMLFLLVPISAYASDMTGVLTIYYVMSIVFPLALVHFAAVLNFSKNGRYRNKKFALKHTLISMSVPIIGIAIMVFEAYLVRSSSTSHAESFNTGIFMYIFIAFIASIPYFIHLIKSTSQQ